MLYSGNFMTVREVARLLRKSNRAIYAMRARGQIRGAYKIGNRLLFSEAAVLSWLDSCAESKIGGSHERKN
jgi:excisionase family DNA binding protein